MYLGFFFTVTAVSQLFAFEEYPNVIASYGIPGLSSLSPFAAIGIVFAEIVAIPLLIGMKISRGLKVIGIAGSWAALLYWLIIGIWQSTTTEFIPNAGLFGAKVFLPQGWWLVCFILALLILHSFASFSRAAKQQKQ